MNANGEMAADTWIDGYYVDASGKWIKDPKNEEHTHKWVCICLYPERKAKSEDDFLILEDDMNFKWFVFHIEFKSNIFGCILII